VTDRRLAGIVDRIVFSAQVLSNAMSRRS